MALSRDDVLHVAKLAHLRLEEAEVDAMLSDLEKIMGHVEQLSQLDTTDVPVTSHLAVEQAPFRPDEARQIVHRDEVLSESPRHTDDGFAVPAFVDEG